MTVVIPKKLKDLEKKVYSDLTAKKRKSGKKRRKNNINPNNYHQPSS